MTGRFCRSERFSGKTLKDITLDKSKLCYLIDDDTDDQEIFSLALENLGKNIRCIMAKNGEDGIRKLNGSKFVPDVIFLDLNMPRMNGIECLKEIKKIEHLRTTRVIIYSTSDQHEMRDLTSRLGADDFILKPSSLSTLTQVLTEIFP
jgi:CheY-like chemotaxis protein